MLSQGNKVTRVEAILPRHIDSPRREPSLSSTQSKVPTLRLLAGRGSLPWLGLRGEAPRFFRLMVSRDRGYRTSPPAPISLKLCVLVSVLGIGGGRYWGLRSSAPIPEEELGSLPQGLS